MHIWLSSEYSQHQDIALHVRLTQLFLDNSIAFHTYKNCVCLFFSCIKQDIITLEV